MLIAAATVTKYLNVGIPTMEVVQLTVASDQDTYASRKFDKVTAAIAQFNVDTDDSISVCNSDNGVLDGTDETVLFNSSSISNSEILCVLWGDEGALA